MPVCDVTFLVIWVLSPISQEVRVYCLKVCAWTELFSRGHCTDECFKALCSFSTSTGLWSLNDCLGILLTSVRVNWRSTTAITMLLYRRHQGRHLVALSKFTRMMCKYLLSILGTVHLINKMSNVHVMWLLPFGLNPVVSGHRHAFLIKS